MDSYTSANETARKLGSTPDRVLRAARRLNLRARRAGSARNSAILYSSRQVERLRAELGPPTVAGLSRIETQVLAALCRAPRGLLSARAVARRAHVSPTAAGVAIHSLERAGLVTRAREIAALGHAHQVTVIRVVPGSSAAIALAQSLPVAVASPIIARRVPYALKHLFWNTHPSQLDTHSSGGYIARRLLQTKSLDGIAWGIHNLSVMDWRHAANARGIDPELRQLALNIAENAS